MSSTGVELPPNVEEAPLREAELFKPQIIAHTGLDEIDFSISSGSKSKGKRRRNSKDS